MENFEKDHNLKMESNSKVFPSFSNHSMNPMNNINEANNNGYTKLKLGQFLLTPLEGLLLNKKMPYGFKFEMEENIFKEGEVFKNLPKKAKIFLGDFEHQKNNKIEKNNNIIKENSLNINNKKVKNKLQKETMNNYCNNNNERKIIMNKCYSGFNKIKNDQNASLFYFSKSPDSPSLSLIEKKIKNLEYKSINDFCDDLRKLWNYQFKNYAKNPNIYQNICQLSLLSDKICKELINEKIKYIENGKKKEEISNHKIKEKGKNELNEIKENKSNDQNKNSKRKNMEEINHLSQLIRTLNREQLKGIIPIISDQNEIVEGNKIEFDIIKLPSDKFKRLEEYVYGCYNINKYPNNNVNKNDNSDIGINKNENIDNKNNIYQNISKSSFLSEDSYKEINIKSNYKEKEKKKEEISNNKLKQEKVKNDLKEIQENKLNEENRIIKRKSMEEINHLSQLIRTLNKQQLKGIIPIISDQNEIVEGNQIEFDIIKLPSDKFKRLEDYVYDCYNLNQCPNNNKNKNENSNTGINKNENKNISKDFQMKDSYNINSKNNNLNDESINRNYNIKEQKLNSNNPLMNKIINKKIINDSDCFGEEHNKEINKERPINKIKKEEFITKKMPPKINKELEEIKRNNNIKKEKNTEEINLLVQWIRALDPHQLKGIIPIIEDDKDINTLKIHEFDLDKLSEDKYNKIKESVHNCINKNKNSKLNQSNNKEAEKNANIQNKINSEPEIKFRINKISSPDNKNSNNNYKMIDKNSNGNENKVNIQEDKKSEDNKNISEKKSLSNSDGMSSDSSLSP